MSGAKTVECPHCGALNVILAGAANKRWMCDTCGGLIDLGGAEAAAEPAPKDEGAPPEKVHASPWMEGLSPEQQAAIRAELAADPNILRNELARVRRETTEKVMGAGARSPVLRLLGALLVLAGAFTAALPFANRFLGRLGDALPLDGVLADFVEISAPVALLLGLGLMISGAALSFGRRWAAHASAIMLVFACFAFQFHMAVVFFAVAFILGLFLTRRALE